MQEQVNIPKEVGSVTKKKLFSLDSVLLWIMSGLVLLLPIFFVPSSSISLLSFKYCLLVFFVVAALAVWILLRLKDGVFLLPLNMLYLAGLVVLLVMLLSSLFSGSIWSSLIGKLPQTDTFVFYLYLFAIMFIVPSVLNTPKRIFDIYRIFFVSIAILAIFHIIRLFSGNMIIGFGYFTSVTDNLLGKWNDLGIFFGLGAILSLISLELLNLTKRLKIVLYSILIVSMFLLSVINFSLIWYILAVLSLVFFVYSVVISRSNGAKVSAQVSLPITSFVVFLISIIFVIGGSGIGNFLANSFKISQLEVRPTWQATFSIARDVIWQKSITHIAFGAGPNHFLNQWFLFKPVEVNSSIFWNTDFGYGVGIVPSALVTTGILGFLSWLAFLALLVYMGFRSILSRIADPFQRYLVTSSFLATLYLWLFNVVYVPSLVIVVLTFFFTGLFIASLDGAGILKPVRFEYFKNPKIGFISVLVLIMILIGGLSLAYTTATKFAASMYYAKAITDINNNKLDNGEQGIIKAISFDNNDTYIRSLAQLYLLRLNTLLSASANSASPDVLKSQFNTISKTALNNAQLSVAINPNDYQNWLTLGDVLSALVPLKIPNAYDSAQSAYQHAFNLNPQNPYIFLELAKLESAQNNADKAKGDVVKALTLKNDYTDAYMLLAQLQISEGDTKSAIDSVTNATYTSPNNEGLFFQLGVLRYDSKDYTNAIGALEKAVSLNSQYSNARYFLGLSYYQVDRVSDAIAQFTEIQKLNPGNQQVVDILTNLQSGKTPFKTATVVAPTPTKTASSTPATKVKK